MPAANYCPGIMLLDFSVQMVTCVTFQKFQHLIFNAVKFKKEGNWWNDIYFGIDAAESKISCHMIKSTKIKIFVTKSKNGEMPHLLYFSESLQTYIKILVYTFHLSRLIEVV